MTTRRRHCRLIQRRHEDLKRPRGYLIRIPRIPVIPGSLPQFFRRHGFQADVSEKAGMRWPKFSDISEFVRINFRGLEQSFDSRHQVRIRDDNAAVDGSYAARV